MTGPDLARDAPRTQRCVAPALRIIAVGDNVIAGAGFLPDHVVVLRVTYAADESSVYLTYRTNLGGDLCAELPTRQPRPRCAARRRH
jgi:hypothetical protein